MGNWRDSSEVAEACARLLAGHDLGRLLDAGGGEGFVTAHLMRQRPVGEATVADCDPELLALVPPPIRTRCRRLEELDDSDGEYSTILVRQVLHYLESPVRTLRIIAQRLEPGGAIYIGQMVTPASGPARWLADAAGWRSPTRHRVWTVDALFTAFAAAGLYVERATLDPHWQELKTADAAATGLATRLVGGARQARLLFVHTLLRHGE